MCLERAVPRRFKLDHRLLPGRDLDLVPNLLHEVANDVELDHLDGVGVEDELARLAGGERRRGARGYDQRRARLLGAHQGARRAALGDQGHAHGPIVTQPLGERAPDAATVLVDQRQQEGGGPPVTS